MKCARLICIFLVRFVSFAVNSAFTIDFVPETKPFRLTESVKAAG